MSAAPTDCRVPDPSDKLDAKADGQFQAVNRRAGYGDDRLERIIATARKGWTLAAGEGLVLVQEIDRLREELTQQSITLSAEHQRAERILAALREPSNTILEAAWCECPGNFPADHIHVRDAISAALAAAEQEVAGE